MEQHIHNNHEVLEAIQGLADHIDVKVEEVRRELGGRIDSVEVKLGARIDSVEGQMGKFRSDMIDHVSRTAENVKDEIGRMIRVDRERFKLFNTKVLSILERNRLVRPEEAEALRELVA